MNKWICSVTAFIILCKVLELHKHAHLRFVKVDQNNYKYWECNAIYLGEARPESLGRRNRAFLRKISKADPVPLNHWPFAQYSVIQGKSSQSWINPPCVLALMSHSFAKACRNILSSSNLLLISRLLQSIAWYFMVFYGFDGIAPKRSFDSSLWGWMSSFQVDCCQHK